MTERTAPADLKLLTVPEFAAACGVSPKSVWRWITAGTLPVYRLGRAVRIGRADGAAFLAKCRSK